MKVVDRMRIGWAKFRFDFWLDIYGVGRRQRRELRRELGANLTDAARDVGLGPALVALGGTRRLALESSREHRGPAWSSGVSAALVAAAMALVAFFALALYYAEGVIDSGVDEPVQSWLFPFVGSSVEVHNQGDAGLAVNLGPGVMPLVVALVVFVAVARPWRVLTERRAGGPFEAADRAG